MFTGQTHPEGFLVFPHRMMGKNLVIVSPEEPEKNNNILPSEKVRLSRYLLSNRIFFFFPSRFHISIKKANEMYFLLEVSNGCGARESADGGFYPDRKN